MCGICGVIAPGDGLPHAAVGKMMDAMVHRGPDGEGQFSDGPLAMGMRRLSIIDLEHGWQPLYNEDRSIALIANGEIYNFKELRLQLEAQGHVFSTGSDCEVIVHLYEEHGAKCVDHLRGMFAFALWDQKRQTFILARDRMGEKPLFLYEDEAGLVFASELKPLLASGLVPFALDPVRVNEYFHHGYVRDPGSILTGVRKLPAGHILEIDAANWTKQESRYWFPEDVAAIDADPVEAVAQVLEETIELTLRADVPVGVSLSGGMDSSVIAALAAQKSKGALHAFSVGYPGRPVFDERDQAQRLAKHLDIRWHDVEISTGHLVETFEDVVRGRDEPIADSSSTSLSAIAELARQHDIPVLLQGHGGDELFWGYSWVAQSVTESETNLAMKEGGDWTVGDSVSYLKDAVRVPRSLGQLWVGLRDAYGVKSALDRLGMYANNPHAIVHSELLESFLAPHALLLDIAGPQLSSVTQNADAAFRHATVTPGTRLDIEITRLIQETYLMSNGIPNGERMGMTWSVEQRLPFVDYRLIETVIGLRKANPDHNLPPKYWLREVAKAYLPEWVLDAPKRGFRPPSRAWYQALLDHFSERLKRGYLVEHGYITAQGMAKLVEKGSRLRGGHMMSYRMVSLELWCQHFSALTERAKGSS